MQAGGYTPPSFGVAPLAQHSAAAAAATVKRPPARSNSCTGLFLALVLLTSAISGTPHRVSHQARRPVPSKHALPLANLPPCLPPEH